MIGEIFDRVYKEAAVEMPPATNVQTTMVPAGGAAIVEFKLEVPGRYVLVDHSLSRLVPRSLSDSGLVRYGFHGLAHESIGWPFRGFSTVAPAPTWCRLAKFQGS
ncbi:MAG: hypothetical protein ACREKS_21000 [Candidatus Rokuibacteriota bacterium]